jgi:methyltransferase (TIGR00027 family)
LPVVTPGLSFVPIDFRDQRVDTTLDGAGHDATRPSLFVCEGLLVYLDQRAIGDLLAGLRSRSMPGSRLVASLAVHDPTATRPREAPDTERRSSRDEPWRTILPAAAAHLELFARAGWSVTSTGDAPPPGRAAVGRRSLLATFEPAEVRP